MAASGLRYERKQMAATSIRPRLHKSRAITTRNLRMATDLDTLKQKLHQMVDREKLMRIACDLVDIPSPTGSEKACADYILARYRAAGIGILPQEFDEERSNAIGVIRGDGTGPTLMFNGHMDT